MAMKGYGKISITNMKNVGQLTVNPKCNMPYQVRYIPDTNTYVPDWGTTPLIIEPVVYFNAVALDKSEYTATFSKQDGSNAATVISSTSGAEAVNNNTLTISANTLKDSQNGILTYSIEVRYTEPKTKATLVNTSSFTFSLLNNPETVKYASISGENVFLYNSKQQIQGSDHITLEASVTGVSITKWKYRGSDGTFVDYPTTHNPSGIDKETLIVYASDSVFFNDKAVIRVETTDSATYDIITISKIRDGAAGGNSVACILTNDSHLVPCYSDGRVKDLTGAETEVHVYEGGVDVTDQWTINYTNDNADKMAVSYNQSSGKYWITSMDDDLDVGTITFTCTKDDASPLYAKFTVAKVKAGVDGQDAEVFKLEADPPVLNRNTSGVYTNASNISFKSKSKVGSAAYTPYSGRFVIFESTELQPTDSDWTQKYRSASAESAKAFTPSSTANAIQCLLLPASVVDTTLTYSELVEKAYDIQSIPVTNDGPKGEDGEAGIGGINVSLGNEAELISCDTSGNVAEDQTITIPYTAYKGIEKIAATASIVGDLPSGMTKIGITSASSTSAGVITLKAEKGGTLGGNSRGEINISINFTDLGLQDTRKFSWSKNIRSKDGVNAVMFQAYAPNGDVIVNGQNSVTIATMLVDGSTVVSQDSPDVSYKWYKFDGSNYVEMSGKTTYSLIVTPDDVDTMASFMCRATYKGVDHEAYYMVTDRSDPFEVFPYSSIGTQMVNNDEPGAVFTRVFLNGVEQDTLKTTIFGKIAPIGPSIGDFYYKLDPSDSSCTLMRYNGSQWVAAGDEYKESLIYKYFKLDSDGNAVDITTAWKTGKAIYFDASDTNPTLDLMVEVTDK